MTRTPGVPPVSRRTFLQVAASAALTACADGGPTAPEPPRVQAGLLGIDVVQLTGPTAVAVLGTTPMVTGAVLTAARTTEKVGIEDGLRNAFTAVTTDVTGAFRYLTRVVSADVCVVTVIARATRYPFLLQAARRVGAVLEADSLHARTVVVDNRSGRDARATWTGPQGQATTITAKKGMRTRVLVHDTLAIPRVTPHGGVRLPAAVLAPVHAVDASGTLTIVFTGAVVSVQGRAFADSTAALRGCWSPRVEGGLPVVRVLGPAEVCLGQTGFRVATVRTPPPGASAALTLRIA
jgi:hypothetical protein